MVKCFDKYPNEKEKHLKTLRILAKIHKFNFTEHPTIEQTEEAAQLCEEYLEIFPVLHPDKDLTRKQFVLGMILPIFIRKESLGTVYKFLTLEECGESLHKILNSLERRYASTRAKAERYLLMKQSYINKLKISSDSTYYV